MNYSHYYSDPHFGHRNIIAYSRRPVHDVWEMEEVLVLNYNATVGEDDHVLWLGDCFWSQPGIEGRRIMDRLNGHKYLVRGNHDGTVAEMRRAGFVTVESSADLSEQFGRKTLAKHYPPKWAYGPHDLRYAADAAKGAVCYLHGHTHETGRVERWGHEARCHVGVDAWGLAPVRHEVVRDLLEEILP